MEKEKIKALYFDKIAEINDYNKAYYNQDNPIISDYKYDRLKIEILNLEKKYKFLKKDCLTYKILFDALKRGWLWLFQIFLMSFLSRLTATVSCP